MTHEYIDLSVYALTGWLLYVLYLNVTTVGSRCAGADPAFPVG